MTADILATGADVIGLDRALLGGEPESAHVVQERANLPLMFPQRDKRS